MCPCAAVGLPEFLIGLFYTFDVALIPIFMFVFALVFWLVKRSLGIKDKRLKVDLHTRAVYTPEQDANFAIEDALRGVEVKFSPVEQKVSKTNA